MEIHLKPEEIPQYTGNLEKLEQDHAALKKDAGHIRSTGSDVHSDFQGLSAFYKAPEAEQLFATTKPVKNRADAFADDLETVASALADYADAIRPLTTKLADLKEKAQAFIRDHKDDDDADYDDELTAEHNQIRDDINATVAAFWAAERTCYNKIVALWNGPKMVAGDGSKKEHQYGFSAEDLKNAKVPWGDPVELKHHWYDVGHWVKSFAWDGIVVDGIWGTIKGLGTLVGVDGWDAAGQAWKGLAQLGTSLAILTLGGPGAAAFMALPDDELPSWLRDSRTAFKETGKALVAWDEWGKNPGRAAGAVTFNALTTVFTGGVGGAAAGAGKAGAVAKAISVAGKAGKVIDPMTYVGKAAGAGLSTVGDITKSLKGVGQVDIPALPEDAIKLPEGSLKLSDGTVHLPEGAPIPEGATRLPAGNVKLPDDVLALPKDATPVPTGLGEPARYFDGQGNLLDEHGKVLQSIDDAPKEGSSTVSPRAGADPPRVEAPVKEPALVGPGADASEDASRFVRLGDRVVPDLDHAGRAGDEIPPEGAHGGGGSSGPGNHLPGGNVGEGLPGGRADDLRHGPSASHEPSPGSHGSGASGSGHQAADASHGSSTGKSGHDGPASGSGHGEADGSESSFSDGSHPSDNSAPESVSGDSTPPNDPVDSAAGEASLDPQVVDERIKALDDRQGGEGHAPGRHLYPEEQALLDRLGTPKLDSDGNPKLYGPNSSNPGHVKSENNIDPLTGTTVDGVSGKVHKVGPYATRFDHAEDMVRADRYFREEITRTGEPPEAELPIEDLLGPDGYKRFTGFYRNPANLNEFLPVDFKGGTIRPVYRLQDGDWKLITMYANPAPGRHP
ncbi:hypothetical protein [Streptomyces ochraceiscleroticus]|uniref:Protein phosphatase n=1 Tax=Streptomyces ochraceiscleroticus TaxID=47761 RepID=A0ABW1MJ06_9ACTN|nr:hypothetical protein [Streptomyces ochraceiscleroticus]